MESRLLLENSDINNRNMQRWNSGEQQQQLMDIHRHIKIAPSSKRSKRAAMKRVVSIPIKGAENARGSNNKSGDGTPPVDCWAWRKYGQKPIKGSPYPRGYYRCSSSKGCPARKQVERSYMDPTMLVITYSSDHNHTLPPPSRSNNNQSTNNKNNSNELKTEAISNNSNDTRSTESGEADDQEVKKVEEPLMSLDEEFGWLAGLDSTPSFMMMESSSIFEDEDSMAMPVMGEEDLSLFADLEELPECSAVFRRKTVTEENATCSDAAWFETTSL